MVSLISCGGPPAPPAASLAPRVEVASPVVRRIVDWHEFTGRVEAVESVEVRARVSGHLQEIRFRSGQMVKRGDVLFVIDPRWHKAALDNAEAQLQQARVNVANAARDAERSAALVKGSAISVRDADLRQTRLDGARAAVLAAQAARDSAALDLEATEVRSPIDGRVSRALLTVGNHVSGVPGFTTLLTTVVSVDPVHVYASIDEASFLNFRRLAGAGKRASSGGEAAPAELQIDGESEFPHRGTIESFDNRIDPATGSIVLRAVFPNSDGALVPGSFARLRIPSSEEYSVLLVDEKIIGTDQGQKFVLALGANNLAEYRPVKLGESHDGLRIVREGLKADDQLITSGLQIVRAGMPIIPLPAESGNPTHTTAAR